MAFDISYQSNPLDMGYGGAQGTQASVMKSGTITVNYVSGGIPLLPHSLGFVTLDFIKLEVTSVNDGTLVIQDDTIILADFNDLTANYVPTNAEIVVQVVAQTGDLSEPTVGQAVVMTFIATGQSRDTALDPTSGPSI